MTEHVFGGDWAREKLERVRKYLKAYTTIFQRNQRAMYFTTYFVDAFAGTGARRDSTSVELAETPLLDIESDPDFIDLWILFPIGQAVNRLLINRKPPPESWSNALTRTFGEDSWRQRFYKKSVQQSLFGEEELETKTADFADIQAYFLKRLGSVFESVAKNPLLLCNSRGIPIYLLCFAVGNTRGAKTAVDIAQDMLRP